MQNSKKSPGDATGLAAEQRGDAMVEYQYDKFGRLACVVLSESADDRPSEGERYPAGSTIQWQCEDSADE